VIEITNEFFSGKGAELCRSSLKAERRKKVRHVRNTILMVAGILVMGGLVAGLVAMISMRSGGLTVPRLVGMKYEDAKKKVEALGLFIEIDPMQDSSGNCLKLKVEIQNPKSGAGVEAKELVTVRLAGLHESPEFVRDLEKKSSGANPDQAPPAPAPTVDSAPPPQTSGNGRSVCLDPGHSRHSGNETDPATGLNVGDNGGATGEIQAMWDLALKAKAALEQAGYSVRLTKDSADASVSLRTRADIGNTCAIMVRLHYDNTGFTGVMRPPPNAARCPVSDPSRVTVVDPNVASASDSLARAVAASLGLSVKDDTGGTSRGNTTPPGHPTCLIGSVLSRVPVICIENKVDSVRNNPTGQDQVASQIVAGVNAYFQSN